MSLNSPPTETGGSWLELFGKSAAGFLILASLALCVISGEGATFSQWMDAVRPGEGFTGIITYLSLVAVLSMLGTPRQALSTVGGYAFGASMGCLWATAGLLAGCAVSFGLARWLAGEAVQKRMGNRLRNVETIFINAPFTATLMLRFCPVGSNALLNLSAGLSRISAPRFFAATLVGYLPQNLIFSLMGSGVAVGAAWPVLLSSALFLVSSLFGFALYSRLKK